ncbi:cytidylate kinase-like family protein [Bacteroidales bacterium OttesenSCG-928-B11]|nr:cytidylate kinase-like family protein [Bacteroidales bacterium OttesenSCG-928-C03]MDL2313241.1 cytidylate kinase-like family protein [Bacteroidales bacterium OttesenSCG-928-B11]MDL2326948.1 cytidylate kinase-like family protein [Bacteroidales bacterium OttesenSCG-928-A14]
MEENLIINIGRQYGSGGREIGKRIAEKLGLAFYDKELINLASKESGLGKEFFEQADEKTRFSFFGNFLGISSVSADDYTYNYLTNENLFLIQSDVIKEIASKQPALFVGRCADYILRGNPKCINIFISADMDDRIIRVCNRKTIEHDKAAEMIEKRDKKRAEYYNFYTNKTWGAAKSYHLCINSSLLGIERTVEYIARFIGEQLSQ